MRYPFLRPLAVALLLVPPIPAAGQEEGIWLGILYGDTTVLPAFEFKNGAWRGVGAWEDADFPGTWYYAASRGDAITVTTGRRLDLLEGGWVLPIRSSTPSDLLEGARNVVFGSRPLEVSGVSAYQPGVVLWSDVYGVVLPLFEDAEASFANRAPYLPTPEIRAARPAMFEQFDFVTRLDSGDALLLATLARSYERDLPPGQGRCPWISRWQGWLLLRGGEPPVPIDAGSFSVFDCDGQGGGSLSPLGSFLWEGATYVVGWRNAYSSWRPVLYRFDGTLVLVAEGPGFGT